MNNIKLSKGHRYLFHEKLPYLSDERIFRANFVAIYETTLVIDTSETEPNSKTQVSIPLQWITKIETLEDITLGGCILSTDILIMIDGYA